jgi:competence protein ComFC
VKRLLNLLDDLLAPRGLKCLCCDTESEGEYLCPDCRKALKALRLLSEETSHGDIFCAYRYDGAAKRLVVSLKEKCLADAAQVLADGMYDVLADAHLPSDTILTWVTMPKKRRIQRGIDHGYELCKALGERCGLPVRQLLQRKGRVHTQRGLNREKRLRNLEGTFFCDVTLSGPVLLVDDVMTTGTTASTCAEALMKAGATRVYVITVTKATMAAERMNMRKVGLYGLYAP